MMSFLRCSLLLMLLTAFTFVSQEVQLVYKFKTGDQFVWNQSMQQTSKQSIPGMGDLTFNVNMDGSMLLRIAEVSGNQARVEAQFTKLKVVSKSLMGDINMDSDGADDDSQTRIAKAVMHKLFYFTITKNGNIEKVEGTENLYSGLNDLEMDEAKLAATKQILNQSMSAGALKASLEMGLLSYPENKVKVGDTWKRTLGLPVSLPVQVNNIMSLRKIEGSTASVQAEGELVTTDKEKINAMPNGIKSKVDLAGRQTLTAKVDINSGWPSEINVTAITNGKMIILAGGIIPQNMDVPMEIKSQARYTIQRK